MKIRDLELFDDKIVELIEQQEYIGVRVSGGIDSAILCAFVLEYFPHVRILPISFFNHIRPGARQTVDGVLKKLKELYPENKLMPGITGTFDSTGFTGKSVVDGIKISPKDVFQRQFIRKLYREDNGRLNLILSGETLNPPLEEQERLGPPGFFQAHRNEKVEQLLSGEIDPGVFKYEYRPFRNFNKKQVKEIGEEIGIVSEILSLTESCEAVQSNYDTFAEKRGMLYVSPGHDPCQYCWPCVEKYWAYGTFDFNTPLKRRF